MGHEAVRSQVEKILASKAFAASEQLRGFLRFTLEKTLVGRAFEIKEYVLGVEVFGRGDAFDPRSDNIVRTQAGKLRARLEKYYASEGQADAVSIEYSKGGYVPVFQMRERAGPRRKLLWPAAAALVLVLVASYWIARQRRGWGPDQAPSIAVLPFVDMSAERDQAISAMASPRS